MLAQQHVEDDAVDLVVDAVVGEDADGLAVLAVAVDAALALLVARGVPGEVVVDDRVEQLLEVDALAEAVGADEDARFGLPERLDASSRSAGGSGPVTASTSRPFGTRPALRSSSATYSAVGMKRQKTIGW